MCRRLWETTRFPENGLALARAIYGTPVAPLATPVDDAEARALRHGIGIGCVERGSSGILRIRVVVVVLLGRTQLRHLRWSTRLTYGAFV